MLLHNMMLMSSFLLLDPAQSLGSSCKNSFFQAEVPWKKRFLIYGFFNSTKINLRVTFSILKWFNIDSSISLAFLSSKFIFLLYKAIKYVNSYILEAYSHVIMY
jgi:hypothetical protein